jgi:KDO2-lipid IV(A) lauroyltransferase
VEYALLRSVLLLMKLLPLCGALWVGRRLGDLAFDVIRIRRQVTLENLRASFGSRYSHAERVRIARSTYRNFGMCFVEFGLFAYQRREELEKRMKYRPAGALKESATAGQGVIVLTAHTGNWEMIGTCLVLSGEPLSVVVGDQKNLMVDGFVKWLRAKQGARLIPIGSALRGIIRVLRAGGAVGLVADQDGGRDGIFIDFFGRPASTAVGPARFAYRTGAAILVMLDRYVGTGKHEVRVCPPIVPDCSRPEDEEVRRMLTEYTRNLEGFVRQYPDSWFWMHRRWKTQPGKTSHEVTSGGKHAPAVPATAGPGPGSARHASRSTPIRGG